MPVLRNKTSGCGIIQSHLSEQCINKFHNPIKCTTTHLTAEQLEQKFLEMFAIYFADRKATIDTLRYVQKTLTDTDFIDDDIEACEREMDILTEMSGLGQK